MDNLRVYNALKQPPKEALRQITGGRLSGKTDINPQWRYKALTEQFGMCGVGWKYEITELWSVPVGNEIEAHALIKLYTKEGDTWSEPTPGIGGSMLLEQESKGLHANDEGYKMAVTDALSVATKMLGVGGDVYAGLWDGIKYTNQALPVVKPTATAVKPTEKPPEVKEEPITEQPPELQHKKATRDLATISSLNDLMKACHADFGMQPKQVIKELGYSSQYDISESPAECYGKIADTRQLPCYTEEPR